MKKLVSTSPSFFSAQVVEARRFYLDLSPAKSQRLAVVCSGSERCSPDYHVLRSTFPYHSVEFVAAGEGVLTLGGQKHALKPGVVFAYAPRVPHEITTRADRPLVKYFVDFVGTSARQLLKSPGLAAGELVQTSAPDHVLRLFDELIDAGLRHTPFTGRLCSAILEQLLLRIAETAVSPGAVGTVAFASYLQSRRHIEAHAATLGSLDEIADQCHLDSAYLCRLFRRFDHQSPYQYLMRLKMLDAAERLRQPGMLVKEVADALGFSDPFNFSRAFRRVIGVSPRQFTRLQGHGR